MFLLKKLAGVSSAACRAYTGGVIENDGGRTVISARERITRQKVRKKKKTISVRTEDGTMSKETVTLPPPAAEYDISTIVFNMLEAVKEMPAADKSFTLERFISTLRRHVDESGDIGQFFRSQTSAVFRILFDDAIRQIKNNQHEPVHKLRAPEGGIYVNMSFNECCRLLGIPENANSRRQIRCDLYVLSHSGFAVANEYSKALSRCNASAYKTFPHMNIGGTRSFMMKFDADAFNVLLDGLYCPSLFSTLVSNDSIAYMLAQKIETLFHINASQVVREGMLSISVNTLLSEQDALPVVNEVIHGDWSFGDKIINPITDRFEKEGGIFADAFAIEQRMPRGELYDCNKHTPRKFVEDGRYWLHFRTEFLERYVESLSNEKDIKHFKKQLRLLKADRKKKGIEL